MNFVLLFFVICYVISVVYTVMTNTTQYKYLTYFCWLGAFISFCFPFHFPISLVPMSVWLANLYFLKYIMEATEEINKLDEEIEAHYKSLTDDDREIK